LTKTVSLKPSTKKACRLNKQIVPAISVQGNSVVIKLKRPYSPFLNIIAQSAHWGAILDKETSIKQGLWDGKADTWWKYRNITKEQSPLYSKANGTGSYKLVEWDRNQQKITLVANEQYWRGPARIKKVIVWAIPEWSTRKAMLGKGDADTVDISIEYVDQLKNNKDVQIIRNIPTLAVSVILFNWSVNPSSKFIGSGKFDGNGIPADFFSDIYARKAVAAAINYDALIQDVLKGSGKRVPTTLPEGLIGYDPSLPLYRFNVNDVKSYLEKA